MRATATVGCDAAAWAALQLAIAAIAVRLPSRWFAHDGPWLRVRGWEPRLYRGLAIRRWKRRLPDGAGWVGGARSKAELARRDRSQLLLLAIETRRAELAHWAQMLCFPLFFLWNPRPVWGAMLVYAVAANLPCIVAQRWNRGQVTRMLGRPYAVRAAQVRS